MTITSTFRHRFQHIIRQIVCIFINFLSMYNIMMFTAQWGPQIKVYVHKNIVCDIISKTVLKIKTCEKYKITGMMLISQKTMFQNTSILCLNAAWMNIIALKRGFRHHSEITKNEQFENYSSHKNFTAYFLPEHHFSPYIFNVVCRFHILYTISFLKMYSKA